MSRVPSRVALLVLGLGVAVPALGQCPPVRSAWIPLGDVGNPSLRPAVFAVGWALDPGDYPVVLESDLANPAVREATLSVQAPCDPVSLTVPFLPVGIPRGVSDLTLRIQGSHAPDLRHIQQLARDGATPTLAGVEELLERHAPVLRLDRDEPQQPVAVEFLMDWGTLRGLQGEAVSKDTAMSPSRFLGLHPERRGYLDLPGSNPTETLELLTREVARVSPIPAVYATAATDPSHPGLVCLQYWFCWAYNDWVNTHEGDWEHITVLVEADGRVQGVSFAQHGYEYPVPAGQVVWEGTRPVVYVGRGSHASYPRSGSTLAFVGTDVHRGDGAVLRPDATGGDRGTYRLVPLGRLDDPSRGTDAWGEIPRTPWMPYSGGWGNPFEITTPGDPSPVYLPGPAFRADWIRPGAPVTVLVASLAPLGTPPPQPVFRVTTPAGVIHTTGETPTPERRFEVGRASAPDFGVSLAWLTLHGSGAGRFVIDVDPVSNSILVGTISWEGLVVRSQGDPPTVPVVFQVNDPEPLDVVTPLRLIASPNPFRRGVELRAQRMVPGPFRVDLLAVTGRRVQTWSGQHGGGAFYWNWDGRLERGGALTSGVYFVRVRSAEGKTLTTRVVRLP